MKEHNSEKNRKGAPPRSTPSALFLSLGLMDSCDLRLVSWEWVTSVILNWKENPCDIFKQTWCYSFLFWSPVPVGKSLAWDGTCFVRNGSLWITWKMYIGLQKNNINKACLTVSKLMHTLMRSLSEDIEIWSKHRKVQTNTYLLKSFFLFYKESWHLQPWWWNVAYNHICSDPMCCLFRLPFGSFSCQHSTRLTPNREIRGVPINICSVPKCLFQLWGY